MLIKKMPACIVLLALIAGLAALAGCDIVTGSGETSTLEFVHSNFTRVEISTGFDVEITQADAYYVSVTIDKSLYDYFTIKQRGDTLLIGLKSNYTYTAAERRAVIRLPDLRRLELSGASRAVVTGFSVTHALDFELSGASSIFLNPIKAGVASFIISGGSQANGTLEVNEGNFYLSGASTLELTGAATSIKMNASGTSVVTLQEFPAVTISVELSGASNAVINVSDLMNVNLSGASNLEYVGNPKLGKMEMSGGSTLNQK